MIDPAFVKTWLTRFGELVEEHADELTQLDAAIGDADHGANMARGMRATPDWLDEDTVDAQLKGVGMTLLRAVGGTAGPLYATMFLHMARGLTDDTGDEAFARAFVAGAEALAARGRARPDDKTMCDVLLPATRVLAERLGAGDDWSTSVDAAAAEARRGRDHTVDLVARKGRASYLGERSKGHMDPGAASAELLFRALQEVQR